MLTVGATIAFIATHTLGVDNTFTPTEVRSAVVEENFKGKVKEDVQIQNTGTIPAYIRAELVFSWQDDKGNVLGIPVTPEDYDITFGSNKWKEVGGFYYYKESVDPNALTEILVESCSPKENKTPAGYHLCVEVIGSAIQADGESKVEGEWKKAVVQAWGVDPSEL